MTKHLSPEAERWLKDRIAWHNKREASPIKREHDLGAECRRDLIDMLVEFTGADRDELRKLTKEDLCT